MVGVLIENNEDYKINIWISLDKGLFININDNNINISISEDKIINISEVTLSEVV